MKVSTGQGGGLIEGKNGSGKGLATENTPILTVGQCADNGTLPDTQSWWFD
jgi:hypothetical protein